MRRRSFLATVASIITYQAIKTYIRYGDRLYQSPTPTPAPFPYKRTLISPTPTRVRARNPFSPLPTPTPPSPLDLMRRYLKH